MTSQTLRYGAALGLFALFGWGTVLAVAAPPEDNAYAAADDEAAGARSQERVGWLRPNYTRPDVDAPFALVDNTGRIRAFVRPATGVYIGRFVNHRIRVRGEEMMLPNQPFGLMRATAAGPPDAVLDSPPPLRRRPVAPAVAYANEGDNDAVRQAAFEEIPPPNVDSIGPGLTADGPHSRLVAPPGAPMNDGDVGTLPDDWANGPAGPAGPMSPGGPIGPGGPAHGYDEHGDGGQCGPPCMSCGGCGHASCRSCCCTPCGPPGWIWVRAEYLYWFTSGMHVPPLVTSGPTADQPGYLGSPGTQILFGGDTVNGFGRSGGRITLGAWLNYCKTIGIMGDYFGLATANTNYSLTGFGSPIISRPFYDVGIRDPDANPLVVGQNVELVAQSGVINGTVSAATSSSFQGAGLRLLYNLCCKQTCSCNPCCPTLSGPAGCRVDFMLGYRYLQLRDSVSINENLTAVNTTPNTTFLVNDSFSTRNQFNGVDLGFMLTAYKGRWSVELIPRMALGDSYQVVNIAGSTTTNQGGVVTNYNGGLLAQQSNIGRYSQNQFAGVEELDLNLGYWITPRLRAIVGYTFLYWNSVARAGDQIDLNVNSTTLPASGVTPTGDTRYPMFTWHTTDFWAQGVNAGLDYRW